jgi:ATP-binding cassette subfamily E protein 1
LPSQGSVLGLLGQNGIGKSTALRILSGEIKLNLGNYSEPPNWQEIIKYFRGSTLQLYFKKMSEGNLRTAHKPQYVSKIKKLVSGKVGDLLEQIDRNDRIKSISNTLQLNSFWNRSIDVLSGGELQRVAIAATICKEVDVYIFDEPSSYLDVKQRLEAARAIRSLKQEEKIIIVAEHDLAILDYLSDYINVLYGKPGIYGVVSNVQGLRAGINVYLEGFIPDENIRFRKERIQFHIKPPSRQMLVEEPLYQWEHINKNYKGFKLNMEKGAVHRGEVVGILGPNGIGKTTFIKILAGIEKPDLGEFVTEKTRKVSYKPQYLSPNFEGTVEELLLKTAKNTFNSGWFKSEISNPLKLEALYGSLVKELSGGELQRVAIASCLSKEADLYLLDEPSAYLDVEERLTMARTVRRIIEGKNVAAFVVEHDVVAQDFLADSIMVFSGISGKKGLAKAPTDLLNGMNYFLKEMDVTLRRDHISKRPRLNKKDSQLDRYQKETNQYYYVK